MTLVGYARVSTGEQDLAPQLDALRAAGCTELFEEHASGASRARPQLAAALARIRRGDTLVVARIDRLARYHPAGDPSLQGRHRRRPMPRGLDPERYLTDVLTKIGAGHPIRRIDGLLPWRT